MPERDAQAVATELEVDHRSHHGAVLLRRTRLAEAWRAVSVPADHPGIPLWRRPRLQGLLLMVASSVVSVLILYELWTLIRRAI